jgi:ketosteroid isomerase-like protein
MENAARSVAMSSEDLALAKQFLDALSAAAQTGDRGAVYPFLAPDVEWVTPKRDVHGIDEAREQLTWIRPPDNLDVEFSEPELADHGEGRITADVHETYRVKGTGDFAYARDRWIDLTVSDGKIARYEMREVAR